MPVLLDALKAILTNPEVRYCPEEKSTQMYGPNWSLKCSASPLVFKTKSLLSNRRGLIPPGLVPLTPEVERARRTTGYRSSWNVLRDERGSFRGVYMWR